MSAGSQQVDATLVQLKIIGHETVDHTTRVASASEEQLASMEEITTASASLTSLTQELVELIQRLEPDVEELKYDTSFRPLCTSAWRWPSYFGLQLMKCASISHDI